jgi:hypothetical protein
MSDVAPVIEVALRMLSARVLLILAMVMTFGLFCYAIWAGTLIALIVATAFALSVFLPVLFKESTRVHTD